jgi:GntR family transcriptional regulator, carbon starvation induced regulator
MPTAAAQNGGEFTTQSEGAYQHLREDIICGRLRPSEKLTLERLRAGYGFGSSPLREALNRLAADKLVTSLGQKGYWVAPVSESEFWDLAELRVFIEGEALTRSIRNATLEWENRVSTAFMRLAKTENGLEKNAIRLADTWEEHNRAFHLALIENCGSIWMLRMARTLFEHSQRYRLQAVTLRAVPRRTLQKEHRAILDAALARDAKLARELLSNHIKNAATGVSRVIFGNETFLGS